MDLKTRLSNARQKLPLLRRSSQHSSAARSLASAGSDRTGAAPRRTSQRSMSLTKLPAVSSESVSSQDPEPQRLSQSAVLPHTPQMDNLASSSSSKPRAAEGLDRTDGSSSTSQDHHPSDNNASKANPIDHAGPPPTPFRTVRPQVTLEEPSPVRVPAVDPAGLEDTPGAPPEQASDAADHPSELRPATARTPSRPTPLRRQSLLTASNARVIKTLLEPDNTQASVASEPPTAGDYFAAQPSFHAGMLHRKIWVKRPNASATMVQIREDDLVDDVRDMILRKYANSLGKAFDSPDITLRIQPRDHTSKGVDRVLGPEEEMCRTLDAYYPGGQTVHDALLIDVPHKRTPKPSPRVLYPYHDETRVHPEHTGYFPPMPVVNPAHPSPAMTIISTGHLPDIPSPGSGKRGVHVRPRAARQNTHSPTTLSAATTAPAAAPRGSVQRQRKDSTTSADKHSTSSGHPSGLPTPPAPAPEPPVRNASNPPTPRVASPRPPKERRKKTKPADTPSLPPGLLDNTVPPINVLIVEDNIINLRVLGAFMQRLKVRWQRAMNGKEAVTKWRAGGFHLVLMDIQLPIMNGLEATKEIRRLERVNSIGVFSSGSSEAPNNRLGENGPQGKEPNEDDKLGDKNLFKSPVIIVALTASSLQSDRHEALAAGCNDFLTKPVNFVWLERKVKEWGCMQALIDFDGWRKWKDFAQPDTTESAKASTAYSTYAARPQPPQLSATSPTANGKSGPNGVPPSPRASDEEKKNKRRSLTASRPPPLPEEESTPSPSPEADDS